MKVAVSAAGRDLNAAVDPRFGRAPYFLLVDTENMEYQLVENKQNLQAAQGAGIQSASLVAGFAPEAVLTGYCGPKAFQTLQAAGVKVVVSVEGIVRDAVAKYRDGKYAYAAAANVEGHWV